jgi:hypothetical protein
MLYTVKYKSINSWFWNKIKAVEGDWLMLDYGIKLLPLRHIMDKNKTCYEISISDYIVIFSNGRPIPKDIKTVTPYSMKYRKRGGLFWKTIKNIIAEIYMYEATETPIKVLILETGERWEIPMKPYEFKVSKEKLLAIQSQMEIEIGQVVNAIK